MRFCKVLGLGMIPVLCVALAFAQSKPATKPTGFAKWEKAISDFEASDRENPPPKNAVLFTGSSAIVLWKSLPDDFKGTTVLNRAFGGSQIFEVTHFADRIIFPYDPKMIVLRCGGNDIHAHKSAEHVFQDYKDFVAKVRTKLPDTPILFISLFPAPSRWSERGENKKLNELVKAYSEQTPALKYVETYDITVTPDDKPREDLFIKDRLHPNAEGYRLLADRVRPFIPKD